MNLANADQVGAWARNVYANLIDNAIRLTPPRILHDPSAPGFLASVYVTMPPHELAALLAYCVAIDACKSTDPTTEMAECRAGRCEHVNCPDRPLWDMP
jgi:hypothetical protein